MYADLNSHWHNGFFADANTGYVVGYKVISGVVFPRIVKTTNAGSSWFEQTSPERDSADFFFRSVFFTDINTGFIAVGYRTSNNIGRILKTTNGGNTWSLVPLPMERNMTTIYFVNSSTGYASGYRTMLKTTDAGDTWVSQNPNFFSNYLFAIHFTEVNTGYVVGNLGTILKTTDGGDAWIPQNSTTSLNLWGVYFMDANTGVVVGGPVGNSQNIILRTTNGGNIWEPVPYTVSTCLLGAVRFISSTTGYITGSCNQILYTKDGGQSWFNLISPLNNYNFRTSFFTSADTGYVVGEDPLTGGTGYVLKTTDGGGVTGISPSSNETPKEYKLLQNYPNPFNPSTTISYQIPSQGRVTLKVYDLLGREVATLVNEELKPGSYGTTWDAAGFASGVYFYRLQSGEFVDIKRLILLR